MSGALLATFREHFAKSIGISWSLTRKLLGPTQNPLKWTHLECFCLLEAFKTMTKTFERREICENRWKSYKNARKITFWPRFHAKSIKMSAYGMLLPPWSVQNDARKPLKNVKFAKIAENPRWGPYKNAWKITFWSRLGNAFQKT